MSNQWLLETIPPVTYKADHPLRNLIADIVDNLPDEDRLLLEAIMWEGVSLSEAATRLGLAARQSAHYRLKRALGLVRAELEKAGIEEDADTRRISLSVSASDEGDARPTGSTTDSSE